MEVGRVEQKDQEEGQMSAMEKINKKQERNARKRRLQGD